MSALRFSVAALSMACLFAQVPAPPPADSDSVIRVDVDLVNILFSVRDRRGGLVSTLQQQDLSVFEEGKQQEIRSFTREVNLPLTIGLLVDVSGSQRNLIEVERAAADQFFREVLREKDLGFLISFGPDVELLQDFTGSAALLRRGLDELRVVSPPVGFGPGPVPTASRQAGTVLFDAVYLAAQDKLKGETGRKAMVIISDGVDTGSRVKIREAIEAAQKADAIVYSVLYADPQFAGFGGGDGDLRRMSEETGGRLFRVDRRRSLTEIFREIQEELRSQYSVAYSPSAPRGNGEFRRIELRTTDRSYKIQARRGYFADAPASR